ncbi:hypothetical protein [Chengkuizengella sediminis]|uniref:hypothetical protein n=1 Tax=Chengkuizengella sediminis TaxID=1885917 RepID=UPI001389AAC5|nr:hypothetical protein [Chengkuizengella sediminis]NDI36445.1 hypothetical protein [Chengkuizengella sediminis]
MKKKLVLLVVIFALIIPQSIFAGSSDEKIKTKIRYDKAGQKIGESKISTKKNKDGEEITIEEKFDNNGHKVGQKISKEREPISLSQTQDVSLKASLNAEPGWWSANTTGVWDDTSIFGTYEVDVSSYSKSYADSSKSEYAPIDLIYVKTQLLIKGTLSTTDSDSNTDASFAIVTFSSETVQDTVWTSLPDFVATSNHKFEHEGYTNWYPTTEDS